MAFTIASSAIFTPKPTGPEKNAIARVGSDFAADDTALNRDGAGVVTADVLTEFLSREGSAGARRSGRPPPSRSDYPPMWDAMLRCAVANAERAGVAPAPFVALTHALPR